MKDIKMSLDFFKKNKRDIYFGAAGLFLIITLIFVAVKSISYLAGVVNKSLEVSTPLTQVTKFNVSGLETLGLIKKQTTPSIKPSVSPQISDTPVLESIAPSPIADPFEEPLE